MTLARIASATWLCLAIAAAAPVAAQTSAADAASAALAAPAPTEQVAAEPRPDDSAAARNKSQPGNNAPVWRAVRDSGEPGKSGTVNVPGAEQGVLIQPTVAYPGVRPNNAGEAWRQVRNRWLIPYGGALLLITLLALALFYWRRGALGHSHNDGRPAVERFTPLERAAHWTNAAAFVVLGVSGVVMAFGKFFLLPVIGGTLFGWLAYALKTAHNFAGPMFAVSLTVVVLIFVKDNIANGADFNWLAKAGGMLGHQVPSHRFNAAEKGIFWWGMTIPGLLMVASGLVLDKLLPMTYLRGDMQIALMVHICAAVVMLVMLIGHIYMGTVGVNGALKGMRTGWVDAAWAAEHHLLWFNDVRAGKIAANRSGVAPPDGTGVAPGADAPLPAVPRA